MRKGIQPWHRELQRAWVEVGITYCLTRKSMIPFLESTLCGEFELVGLGEEFVKETLDMMFEGYRKKKEEMSVYVGFDVGGGE